MNLLVSHNLTAVTSDRLPPVRRDGPARVLFLSVDTLGWKTSSHQLIAATAERPDIAAVHILLQVPLWMKVLNRQLPRMSDHLVNPAVTWRWLIRRWLRGPLDGRRFDVIHANPQITAWAAAELKERLGYRLSVTCDTTEKLFDREQSAAKTPRHKAHGDPAIFAAADLIASLSTWCARSIVEDYGVDPAKVLLTPPTVAAPPESPAAADSNAKAVAAADRPKRIVFVGNDFARKGGPRLLWWHQSRWAERGVELHVASAEAAHYPPARGVTWHGRLDHARVISLIASADLMIHPTTGDMSALVVAEAATLGVPVVTSRLAGIPDLVREGESGFLIDPHDDAGFIAAAERVLFDDALRARLSVGARTFAREVLDTNVVYGRLLDRIVALAAMGGGR